MVWRRYARSPWKKSYTSFAVGGIDAVHLFEIGQAGVSNSLGRAESLQQGALARRADAGDFIQGAAGEVFLAARAMRADGEAMRLVAQPLDEIKRRIARAAAGTALCPRRKMFRARLRDPVPLAIATIATSLTPRSASTVRVASNWPLPPSIRMRSGRCGNASGSWLAPSSSLARRVNRRRSTSRIMPKSSPGVKSSPLMLKVR